jgi:hypothetical protein
VEFIHLDKNKINLKKIFMTLATSVVYTIFNRPQITKKSFEIIRQQKPSKLFIIADGPRPTYIQDKELCIETRKIVENIDWQCEVYRNYAESNLGLKKRTISGLDWAFTQTDRIIFMEDDNLAHPDFFKFCENLLIRYSKDKRISGISGCNFQHGILRGNASYYFSKYPHNWGWATWKRTWENYDGNIKFWPSWRESEDFNKKFPNNTERRFWKKIFDQSYYGKIDSWGYPLFACMMKQGLLTVTPNFNLISNIGFGKASTHTKDSKNSLSNLKLNSINNFIHPKKIEADLDADNYDFKNNFSEKNYLFPRILFFLPKILISFILNKLNKFIK